MTFFAKKQLIKFFDKKPHYMNYFSRDRTIYQKPTMKVHFLARHHKTHLSRQFLSFSPLLLFLPNFILAPLFGISKPLHREEYGRK